MEQDLVEQTEEAESPLDDQSKQSFVPAECDACTLRNVVSCLRQSHAEFNAGQTWLDYDLFPNALIFIVDRGLLQETDGNRVSM